jgi:hypothetical protein
MPTAWIREAAATIFLIGLLSATLEINIAQRKHDKSSDIKQSPITSQKTEHVIN